MWRLAYGFAGRQKLLALGNYPLASSADARTARDTAKKLIAEGTDPSELRKSKKQARKKFAYEYLRDGGQRVQKKLRVAGPFLVDLIASLAMISRLLPPDNERGTNALRYDAATASLESVSVFFNDQNWRLLTFPAR
ncbi:MAG: DUF4102 domain-containing protein [Afipia sp.]|nr:DUF4102 domain-containing protein [Afipia sp.]